MEIKDGILNYWNDVKTKINASLTKQIKSFHFGFANLAGLTDTALLFLISPSKIEQESRTIFRHIIKASFIIQIKNDFSPYETALNMIDEICQFIIENNHLGGCIQTTLDTWEIDTDDTGRNSISAIDVIIEM